MEVRQRGERVIRRDVRAYQHDLSSRQAQALMHILEHGSINIQEFETLCPETNRRTLQRELRSMVEKGVLVTEGATNRRIYRLKG